MTSGGVSNQNMGGMQQGGPMGGMQQGGGQVGMQQGGGGQGGAPQPGMGMQQGMMQQRYRPINLQQHQGQFGAGGGGGGAAQFQQPAPPYQTANMGGGGPRGMNPGGFQRDAMGGMGGMRQDPWPSSN